MRLICLLFFVATIQIVGGERGEAQSIARHEAVRLLMEAYRNGGFNPLLLKSGEAEFERNVKAELNLKFFDSLFQTSEEDLKKKLENDEKNLTEIQKAEIRKAEVQSTSVDMQATSDNDKMERSRMRVLFLGNDRSYGYTSEQRNKHLHDYKQLRDVTTYQPSIGKWIQTIDITTSADATGFCIWFHWQPNGRLLHLNNLPVAAVNFQLFGRFHEGLFCSIVAPLMREKLDRQTFTFPSDSEEYIASKIMSQGLSVSITGEVSYDSDAKAKVVEIKKGDLLLEKYHIDVDRGYLCPYQFVSDEQFVADKLGGSVSERIASDFIQEKISGLFFPQKYRERVEVKDIRMSDDEYTLIPDTLRLNQPVSDKEFTIDIPEGSRVADVREPDKQIDYVAMKDGTISLAKGGYDLPELSWLARTGAGAIEDYVPSRGGAGGWVRWLLMSIGIALILIALYHEWKKRVSQ